jgi:g-D-glutamyl-meso-diaminopimelate peptidase
VPPESANAGFKDWFLQVFKRPAFTIEAGLGENPLPTSQLPEITRALSAIFTAAMQW